MTAERKTIFRNLVAFSAARPPWTVFMIFIGVFAFGFFLLGFYVHKNSIVDSEATKVEFFISAFKLNTVNMSISSSSSQTSCIFGRLEPDEFPFQTL